MENHTNGNSTNGEADQYETSLYKFKDERDAIQKKTFTKWVNKHLKKAKDTLYNISLDEKGVICRKLKLPCCAGEENSRDILMQQANKEVYDLFEDLRNGHNLISLLEVLSSEVLPREKGSMRFHMLQNVQIALDFLRLRKIKLVNIRAEDIVDGNPKLTLGLIWTIILHFQISDIITHQTDERITAKEALLRWAQRTTDKYPGVRVGDFTSSWRDGLAFNAIIHRNRPDLVDYRTCLKRNARQNLDSAFTVAERELNVTKLLDPEDVDTPEPDEKSLITYISSLYDVFPRPPSHNPFATDDEKVRKVEEYRDLASTLLIWMREALSVLQDRNFPSTLVEMKALLADCTRFKIEDIPPRLHDKQRLIHWSNEIQKVYGGSLDIHDEQRIEYIERYWDRLINAHQERDQAIHDEIAKLEKLQRLAEKVHRETKQCDGRLDDIERHISEEEKKLQRILSTDAKHNCDQIESDLRHVEDNLKSMARDVQTLRDGHYPQASDLHRRVQQLHERFLNLRMNFQSRVLSVLAVRSLKAEERKVKRPLSLEKLIETNKTFKFLQECYEWVQNKLKYLEDSEYGSDLQTAQSLLEQHHTEHRLIDQFQKNVEQCSIQKTQFRGEELELYCKLLLKLEKGYSELLITSNKRMSDLDTLVDFLQTATNELIWMSEKEEVEVGRDWSSNSLNLLDVEQYQKSFTIELEKREIQFSSIQDRGESLVLQKHPASKCIEAYLAAMQTQWSWLLQLISCLDVHIKYASIYQQFFNESKECQQWLKRIEERLNTTYSRQSFSIDEGERLMKEMQELRDDLSHYSNVVSTLIERSKDIAPLKQRRQPLPRPLRVTAVCAYKHHSMSVAKDEHCWLHDNSQRTKWRIINSSGLEGMVPGVCFLIPPPSPEALELAESLKKQFEIIVNLWTLKQRKLRQNMIFATIKIIKSWDITKFRSIEPNQRESIIKALNEDTQKLLNEGSSDDPALKRLQEEIAYCNKLFADLQRMLDQDEIDRVNKSQARKFNDLASLVQTSLTERERLLKQRTQAAIPRSRHLVDELMQEHKEFESELQTVEPKVAEVREAFRELASKTPALQSRHDSVMESWNNLWSMSSLYVERLKSVELANSHYEESIQVVSSVEMKLVTYDDMPADINEALKVEQSLMSLKREMSHQQTIIDRMVENVANVRHLVELSRPNQVVHADVSKLEEDSRKVRRRWDQTCTQIHERLRAVETSVELLKSYRGKVDEQKAWVSQMSVKMESMKAVSKMESQEMHREVESNMTLYTTVGHRKAAIEEVNVDGGRFIREAKIFDLHLKQFKEGLEDVQPILDMSAAKKAKVLGGADLVSHELDTLNQQYSDLANALLQRLNELKSLLSNQEGQKFSVTIIQAAPIVLKTFHTELVFERMPFSPTLTHCSSYSTSANTASLTQLSHDSNTFHCTSGHYNYTLHDKSSSRHDKSEDVDHTKYTSIVNIDIDQPRNPMIFEIAQNKQLAGSTITFSESERTRKLTTQVSPYTCITELRTILDPFANEKVSWNTAVYKEIIKLNPVRYLHPKFKHGLTLSEAVSHKFIEEDFVRSIILPCGIHEPETNRELSLVEVIQNGMYDSHTASLKSTETNIPISLEEAISSGLIAKTHLSNLFHQRIIRPDSFTLLDALKHHHLNASGFFTDPTSGVSYHLTEAYELGFIQVNDHSFLHSGMSFSEAIDNGFVNPETGLVTDPDSGEGFPISKAISHNVLHVHYHEIVDTELGQILSLDDALKRHIVNEKNCYFFDSKKRNYCSLIEARRNKYVVLPLTLRDAYLKKLFDDNGNVTNPVTQEKNSILQAIAQGVFNVVDRCILCPSMNDMLTIPEALVKGVLATDGCIVDLSTQEKLNITQAANRGLLASIHHLSVFEIEGFQSTTNREFINFNTAVQNGMIDVPSGKVKLKSGEKLSFEEAVKMQIVQPQIYDMMSKKIGIQGPNGQELTLIEAVSLDFIDTVKSCIKDPVTKRPLYLFQAINNGFITEDGAVTLKSLFNITVTLTTVVKSTTRYVTVTANGVASDSKISFNDAFERGLIDETDGTFKCLSTGDIIPLEEAIAKGLLGLNVHRPTNFNLKQNGIMNSASNDNQYENSIPEMQSSDIMECESDISKSDKLSDFETIKLINTSINEANLELTNSVTKIESSITSMTTKYGKEDMMSNEPKTELPTPSLVDSEDTSEPISKSFDPVFFLVKSVDSGYVTYGEAEKRGLVDTHTNEYVDGITGKRLTLQEAKLCGLVIPFASLEFDAFTNNLQGILDTEQSLNSNAIQTTEMDIVSEPLSVKLVSASESPVVASSEKETSPKNKKKDSKKNGFENDIEIKPVEEVKASKCLKAQYSTPRFEVTIGRAQTVESPAKAVVLRKVRKKKMPLEDAAQRGLVDLETVNTVEGVRTMKDEDGQPLSLQEAVRLKVIDGDCGAIANPSSKGLLTIGEALGEGVLDSDSGQLILPVGRSLSIPEAVVQGLIEPHEQKIVHPEHGDHLTIEEAIVCDIIDPSSGVKKPTTGESVTLECAIDMGIVDSNTSEVKLSDTDRIGILEAVNMDIFESSPADFHFPPLALTFPVALSQGVIDLKSREYIHPITSEHTPLSDALQFGLLMVLPPSQAISESTESTDLWTALDLNLIDPVSCTFKEPISGQSFSVTKAIDSGLLRITLHPNQVNGIVSIEKGIFLLEDLSQLTNDTDLYLTNMEGNKFLLNSPRGQHLLESNAIVEIVEPKNAVILNESLDKIISDNPLNSKHPYHFEFFDENRQSFINPITKDLISFSEIFSLGILEPSAFVVKDDQTNEFLPLKDAFISHFIDKRTGSYTYKAVADQTVSCVDAVKLGLILCVKEHKPIKIPKLMSFSQALQENYFDLDLAVFQFPPSSVTIPLNHSLVLEILNSQSILIYNAKSEELISLPDAVDTALVSLEKDIYVHPITLKEMDLRTAFMKGIIIPKRKPMSLKAALNHSLYDPVDGNFADNLMKQKVNIEQAVQMSLIDKKLSLLKNTKSGGKYVTLEEAIHQRIVVAKSGKLKDTETGVLLTFDVALQKGLIETVPLELTLITAIREEYYDPENGTFFDPTTGNILTLNEAFQAKNFLNFSTTLIKHPNSEQFILPQEALSQGILNGETGCMYQESTQGKQWITLDKALNLGFIVSMKRPFTLKQALNMNLFDTETGLFLDPESGLHINLLQALDDELIDKNSALVNDKANNTLKTLYAAVNDKDFDESSGKLHVNELEDFVDLKVAYNCERLILFDHAADFSELLNSKSGLEKDNTTFQCILQEAIAHECINVEQAVIKDPQSRSFISLRKALSENKIFLNKRITFYVYPDGSKSTIVTYEDNTNVFLSEPKSFEIAINNKSLDTSTGMYLCENSKTRISLRNALLQGCIDPDTAVVLDTKAQVLLPVMESFNAHILDPNNNTVIDTISCRILTLRGALDSNILLLSNHTFSIIEALEYGLYVTSTAVFKNPFNGASLNLNAAIESGLLDPTSTVVRNPNDEFLSITEAMEKGIMDRITGHLIGSEHGKIVNLLDAYKDGLLLPASRRIAIEEKYRLYVDNTGKLLSWLQEVEVHLAEIGLIREDADELHRQTSTAKTLNQDIVDHQRTVMSCIDQVHQLIEEGKDVLGREEIHYLQKNSDALRKRYTKANHESEKLLRRLNAAFEELRKFSNELITFMDWMKDAHVQQTEKERSLADLDNLKANADAYKAFSSDAIAHQADLRFITMAAQKFIDESKDYLKVLNDFRTNLPHRLAHLEPGESDVKAKVQEVTDAFQNLLHRIEKLSDRFAMLSNRQRDFSENVEKAHVWLSNVEKSAKKLIEEPIAADPRAVQDQLDQVKVISIEIIQQGRLIESVKHTSHSLLVVLEEAGASASVKRHIEEIVAQLEEDYTRISHAINAKSNELQMALIHSQDIQDGLDRLIKWLDDVESMLRNQSRPISLIKEKLDEQIQEHKLLLSDIDGQKPTIDAINDSAQGLLNSSNTRLAKKIENKLKDVNSRFEKLCEKAQKRSDLFEDVCKSLGMFQALSGKFEDWLGAMFEVIRSRDGDFVDLSTFDEVINQRDAKRDSYEEVMRSGKNLMSKRDVTDTNVIKEKIRQIEQLWKELSDLLTEKHRRTKEMAEQLSAYESLRNKVLEWLNHMELRVEKLEPVGLDKEVLRRQLQEIKPLQKEHAEYAPTIDRVNDLGNTYDAALKGEGYNRRGGSPTRRSGLSTSPTRISPPKLRRSPDFASPQAKSPYSSISSGFGSSRSSAEALGGIEDLSPIQQQLSEINHRFMMLGTRLSDRSQEIGVLTDEIRVCFDSLKSLQAFVQAKERQLPREPLPVSKDSASKQLQVFRTIQDEMHERQSEKDRLKAQTADLVKRKPDAHGVGSLQQQVADVDTRWKELQSLLRSRMSFLKDMENFQDAHDNMVNWLGQKEKMFQVLGPIASEPRMVTSQIQQLQVLRDEFTTQEPVLIKLRNSSQAILDQIDVGSQGAKKVREQVQSVNSRWDDLLGKLSERERNLDAASGATKNFQDSLNRLHDRLQHIGDEFDNLSDAGSDAEDQLRKLTGLEEQLEDQRPLLADAEIVCNQLCNILSDSASKSEIKNKFNGVEKQYNNLNRKMNNRRAELESSMKEDRDFHYSFDRIQHWLNDMESTLARELPISANRDVLRRQISEFEVIYKEVLNKDHEIHMLMSKGTEMLPKIARKAEAAQLQNKMDNTKRQWDKVRKAATDRHTHLQACSENCKKFHFAMESFVPWLNKSEDKFHALDPISLHRSQLDKQVKEIHAFKNDLSKHSQDYENTRNSGEVLITSCDVDTDIVKDDIDDLRKRWDRLNHGVFDRSQALDDISHKLNLYQDKARDVHHSLNRLEDRLHSHDALGDGSKDPKLLARMKSLLSESDSIWKLLDNIKDYATRLVAEASPSVDTSHITQEVEDLEARHKHLKGMLEDRCSDLESASEVLAEFNNKMKDAHHILDNLDEELDNMSPIARDIKTVNHQINEIRDYMRRLKKARDDFDDVEHNCQNIISHGYTPDPKGCRNQLDSLHRQLIRLEERSKSREAALGAMLSRLEKFYEDYKIISRELDDTGFEESSFKMIGGEIDTIRSQQDHFKTYRRDRLEPLGKHMDSINKTGQGLIQSAAPGVNTNVLEQDLDALNDRWNSLKQKMNERERRLDAAFLQSGKFQEALDGVLKWLADTEDMVAHQKPPSADYKVVKAQLQEQKFLNKLLMDRQSNMLSLMAMGQDVMNNLEPIERNHVESQLNDLMHRFDELTQSAQDRTEALERTIPVAKAFQDKMSPLIEWLEQVEKKLGAMATIPSDQDKIRQRILQHEALHEDIMDHKEAFEELTEIAQTLMGLVGDDEAQTVVEKLQDVTNHYAKIVEDSEHLGHLLAEAYQGVGSFTVNYEDLMAWIDEMTSRLSRFHTLSVYVEKLQEQLDELVELSEEIADHQKQVDDVANAGQDIMKHASGDDVIHMKEKLDNLGIKFGDLTSRAADRLRQAQESLPSVQNFHSSHKRVTLWMDTAERQLKSLESVGLTSQESIIQKLEREIQENRTLVDTLNHLGPQLCQMSPGEGAAVIESEVTKVNRRFDVICEQVQRKAERIDLSKQRNVEVIGDIEDLLDWFHEVEKQLRHAEPLTADPDALTVLLKAQKILNDEVSSQKGRVRDTLSAAKKLMRESSSGEDLAELRGKSDDLKDIANTVSSLCSERLAALEHALPLAEHFFETHADLCQWLDEMEAETDLLEAPALNAHHIKKQQDRNKALMQSVNEHKALVDKLNKTGAALKKLCTIQEGAKVQNIIDSDNGRYNALKDILRDRQNALEEAMQATSQFSDKLDGMLNALSNTADQLNNAEPVSAHTEKIEEQLGDNQAVLKDLDKRSTALEAVKRAADDVIVKAGNARDPAVRDIKQKLDKLNDLWDNIQKLAHNRGRSLEDALAAAEKFWDELTMVMKTLNELQESLNHQQPPAVEPDAIQHQQDVLQEIRQEIEQTKPEVDQCRIAGQDLMQLCGEPDKPEVKKHIEDLDSAWENITTLYAKREQNLIDAMEKAMNFHDILQNLLEFLDYAEENFASLGPVGSDIEAVKGQIVQLKSFKNEVDPHMVEIESLNRQAHDLMERTSPAQARAIREPLSEINRRWDDLLKAMVDRQTELENALLRLGQFQHALDEFLVWISKTESTLDDMKPVFGDPQVIEVELAKHKVLTNDIQAHQTSVDTLNRAGRQLIEANRGSEDASVTQNKLHNLNKRWQHLQDKASQRQNELEDALKEAQIFNQEIQDLLMWLSDIDSQLVSSKPVGGLPETAREQLSRFMELYNDLDTNKHKVDSVLHQGQTYLKRSNEGAASNLQHNLRTLKQRWENVLNRANDRKIKLEIALREATEFHEALQDFVEWLTSAEKFLSNLKPVSRVMDVVLEQIDDHKTFQKEVASHREVMLNLDKKGTHLKYFSQKQDVILIKNLLISVQHRWERVVSKAAERTRSLDHGYKEAKEFHDIWSDLTNWLNEAEKGLNQVSHVGNDPEKIKYMLQKHKEFQRALGAKQPLYDGCMKLGRTLKEKCPKSDVPTLQGMMDDLKNKWNNVCSKSVDRQRKLEEALLFSGQFKDAVQALLDWLEKAKLTLSENKLLHGDLDTVMALVDQHKSFQDDLKNRANNLESVRRTAKELLDSANPDDAEHIRSQIQTLDTIWFDVAKLSDDKQRHLEEALREAERLHKAVHMLLEWLSDAEMKLRFSGPLPDDEETTKQQIEDHQRFMAEMAEQEIHKDATIAHAQEVLKKCHPDGISVIRHWITIIQSRWEEVSLWAKQREQRLNDHLRSLRDVLDLLEELLTWLIAAEASLMALEAEPLPDDIPVLEQLIIEHQGFMDDMTKRQPDVERVTKAFQSKRQPQQQPSPTGKDKGRERHESVKSGRGTPSIGKAPSRQPFEPDIKNPKARELVEKWRTVWLLAMERQRRLEDKLNYLKELERIKNFDFDEWRKKFLAWMNHKKSRVMDLFRKIDKDNDGKVTREDFIEGILKSKFPTSRLEMERVAEIFDRNGDGFVDHKEYLDTLRPDREKGPLTEAEKIQDEVQRQVAQCTCVHRFKVYQVGEGKYRFGESQKLRLVRILRSTVMVRVGGGWVALDEFLVKNDPCRAKGRTNLELREQFILAEGVSQSLQPFKPKASPQSSQSSQSGGSSFTRPGMTLPATGPITKIREKSERSVPMRQQRGLDSSSDFSNTSYSEADSSFGSRSGKMRSTPNRLTPGSATNRSGGSRPSSRPSSRPPSRATSDLTSEQVDGYRARQNASSGARQRTPSASSSSSSLRQPAGSSGTRIPAIRRTPSFGSSKATPEKRERERWK